MIPISIHPYFWIMAALIGWFSTLNLALTFLWIVIILVSVLVHEMGHALTAKAFGQKAMIKLAGLGGATLRTGKKLNLWQEFAIVIDGPLAGFSLAVIAYYIAVTFETQINPVVAYMLDVTYFVNFFWTVFNLFPIQPLDGGRLMSIVLEGAMGFKGVKAALFISMVFSAVLGLFFFAYGNLLAGTIFFIFGYENYSSWKTSQTMTEQDRDKDLWNELHVVEDMINNGSLDEAYARLVKLREKVNHGIIDIAAAQYMAEILIKKQHEQEAYELLLPLKDQLSVQYQALLQQLAFKMKNYKLAVQLGDKVYQEAPTPYTALVNALAHACLHEIRPTIGWLQCAKSEGLPNFKETLQRREFDLIRGHESFRALET